MAASSPHTDRRTEAWSRIDTTKTEDMVPSSELRGWLVEYCDLFEQLEAKQVALEKIAHGELTFDNMREIARAECSHSYPASRREDA